MKKVLFVDDEEYVLKVIRKKFDKTNIKCYFANNVEEALDILNGNDIDVMVTDIQMPSLNGIELSKIVNKISPRTVRIVLSGNSRVNSIIDAINEGHVYKYIIKPWKIDEAAIELINEAIDKSKRYDNYNDKTCYVEVKEIKKFTKNNDWVLTDSTGEVLYQNSEYPLASGWKDEPFVKIDSSLGELKLFRLGY